MIITMFLDREEFAAKRRKAQDDAVEALLPFVRSVLGEEVDEELADMLLEVFKDAYQSESGKEWVKDLPASITSAVNNLLGKSTESSDAQATTLAIASMLINQATVQAAIDDEDDLFLEWVTMHDDAVRQAHKDTDGQVRPIGEKFDVDGVEMSMPGDVSAPIELWINCRCTLRPTFPPNEDFAVHTVPEGGTMTETTSGSTTSNSYIYQPPTTTVSTSTGTLYRLSAEPVKDDEALTRLAEMDEEQQSAFDSLVPWHGVLAPEGVASGDGRTFAPDSLTTRDLPLPLTYQKTSDDGHKGSVTVGSIETVERVDGLMLATGWFLSTPEADEVIGLMAHFGKYGVSVDADDAEFDYDEESNAVTFTKARICSASIVSIPAFAEAYVALGPWAEDEALVASGVVFKDLAPGKTEDGPGWLTHPVDTDRLRDYWVRGPGAAKIGWGTPGDFNRCRLNLAKYVKPQYLSGYCANRHYDALGFWPGRPVSGDTIPFTEDAEAAPAVSLVASAKKRLEAPAGWFTDPEFTKATHLTVTAEGEVYGHAAQWGVCHIGIQGVCTEAPKSLSSYAAFANKAVLLDNGEFARTGVIHLGGKHARNGRLSPAVVTQHYDDTSRAVADVAIGEDEFGIWVHGWVRPGTSEEDIAALRASDISGDWREIDRFSNQLEMVALLAVNAGGFPVRVAASGGQVVSLVAAGHLQSTETDEKPSETDVLAEAFAKALERVEQNKAKRAETMAALRNKHKES